MCNAVEHRVRHEIGYCWRIRVEGCQGPEMTRGGASGHTERAEVREYRSTKECTMSMQPQEISPVPAETTRIAQAAFPHPTLAMHLRDTLGLLYKDADVAALFPTRGQPAEAPWRLAVVTVLQFVEGLADRQAARAGRGGRGREGAPGPGPPRAGLHPAGRTAVPAR